MDSLIHYLKEAAFVLGVGPFIRHMISIGYLKCFSWYTSSRLDVAPVYVCAICYHRSQPLVLK